MNISLVFQKTLEHLYLAGISTLLAILIGIPIGILLFKKEQLKKPVLGVVNILQTIPSLALLAFLIPFLGIGVKPALITLALYALLPIVRNSLAGLEGVSAALIEAADGIGFTPKQKLLMVEIPIAMPVMIAGIRTAAVMSVGIATVAAFIGAGGLGDFIFQGITTGNNSLVLLGAIPAALLALLMDFSFGRLEQSFSLERYNGKKRSKWKLATVVFAVILVIGAFLFLPFRKGPTVVVASKDFTEQLIIGEMIAQLLEEKGDVTVKRQYNLGTTDVVHQAMLRGEVDIYPEYTGTASLIVLKENPKGQSAEALFQKVREDYHNRYQIKWLEPLGFSNTQALVVREDFAALHNLEKISDLTMLDIPLSIAAAPEFKSRPDGYPALQEGYGINFDTIRLMAPSLMYEAIDSEQVEVIMGFSTDARHKKYNLKHLKDDKEIFPHYNAAILIRERVLESNPQIEPLLSQLSGLIDAETMQRMNHAVEVEKQSPKNVARSFLIEHNLD